MNVYGCDFGYADGQTLENINFMDINISNCEIAQTQETETMHWRQ